MKPAPFRFVRADRLEAVFPILDEYGSDARLLAGGQSLIPLLNMRLARPAIVVDINSVADLAGMEDGAEGIRLGALTRHQTLVDDTRIARAVPVLSEGARFIGHRAIRTRGTLGGSLAHADPAAELPLVAVLLKATILVRADAERRRVAADAFFVGPYTTVLEPPALIEAVIWPRTAQGTGAAMAEYSLRPGDFAIVAVGVCLTCDSDGVIRWVRWAVTSPDGPKAVEMAGAFRLGDVDDVAAAAFEGIPVGADAWAGEELRRRWRRALARQTWAAAYRRARQEA
jgi:carbon-monoxide dehydrogenase medium subunit